MNQPFLISTDELKEFGFMHGNVEDSILSPTLRRVQDTWLIGLIGSSLFDRLLQGVNDDDLNSDEEYLINEKIKLVLISGVDLKLIIPLIIQSKNSGAQKIQPDGTVAVTRDERKDLTNQYQVDYNTYATNLINYLKDNQALFPEYCESECTHSFVKPADVQTTNKVFFL